ncbi:hypothetical protein [Piscinibacter defluvii]|uniref:hypothetical protein n=1 Tax=Piscinibacter defluvii TaxID=1796922 RepID=UPI000FDE1507|nr:hypothetical protein [Piscinibacter defluvii]
MHQDRCVQIAREAAVACGERHSYMPATDLLAETWQPHRWVVDAMLLAANEAETQRDQFRNGNTTLLGLLMKLHAGEHSQVLRDADTILRSAGLVRADGTLDWDALEARRPKQQTWAEAVNECVTDPEARARLLAMDDSKARCEFCKREIVSAVEGPPCGSLQTAERCDAYRAGATDGGSQ